MTTETMHYQSYVLRMWTGDTQSGWRATLVNIQNPDDRHGFASLDDLSQFLNNASFVEKELQTEEPSNSSTDSQFTHV